MMETSYVLGVFAAMAIVTFALRAIPFLAAQWLRNNPLVRHLGRFLPLAIMTLLVLHSVVGLAGQHDARPWPELLRSEEHTSELQSLMRISYAVFCLQKKKNMS